MTLLAIVMATLIAGIGSVWLAAALMRWGPWRNEDPTAIGHGPQNLLSLAAGALLATAFMHLLPEAFESPIGAHQLFIVLLCGLVFFFLLDKAELWHHGHEHHHDLPVASHEHGEGHDHGHAHAHVHPEPGPLGPPRLGGWAVLTGDSVHCFGDGILIASAFMADLRLGLVAAMAVLAHEIPHHIGDLVVLRGADNNRRAALLKVSLAGGVTSLGGLTGFWLVEQLQAWLPYFLVVASSSFIYVALADLIPQLQKRLSLRQTMAQIGWLALGIFLVSWISGMGHAH